MKRRICLAACAVALIAAASAAHADASLRSAAQLKLALGTHPPCCVIDARTEAQRKSRPVHDALPYRKDLTINPTATVIVLADTDAQALSVAQTLARAHPGKPILAVAGGVAVWESVVADISAAPPGGKALSFVIPRNTCEQAPALQNLRSGNK